MPSPFPGMDPFVELRTWHDFRPLFLGTLKFALVPRIRPKYIVETEERVYLERFTEDPDYVRPDLMLVERTPGKATTLGLKVRTTSVASMEPSLRTVPVPEDIKERYLVIKERQHDQVVTVIEELSPANKRKGGDGRKAYLKKRREVLRTETSLVEIDLLRGGQRMPLQKPIGDVDYCAVVCRGNARPKAELYEWMIREQMPTIPIPLADGDPDVPLDLQRAFNSVYDSAGYDYSLPYDSVLKPKLREGDEAWMTSVLKGVQGNRRG